MDTSISFFTQDIDFDLNKEDSVKNWILFVVESHGYEVQEINYIFCSDPYLLELNKTHLQHDYYTDILTFPYAASGSKLIASDIYISIDRVEENANSFENSFTDELHRVMIHGIFHLLGYDDHSDEDIETMRTRENEALSWRRF